MNKMAPNTLRESKSLCDLRCIFLNNVSEPIESEERKSHFHG